MFALSFEIGFVRKLCSNGVIFDKKTVKVKIYHNQKDLKAKIDVDVTRLGTIRDEFKNYLLNLKRFHVPKKFVFPMFCKALNLSFDFTKEETPFTEKRKENFLNLRKTALELSDRYTEERGENAFSALNVMTDLISHQDQYNNLDNYQLRANSYYGKISQWMKEYVESAEQRDFKLESYLKDQMQYMELLN